MIGRSYVVISVLLTLTFILLTGCQDHQPPIENFGQLDSAQVAADTTMQVNMDRSYEYQRSLPESDTVVYDFLAYDKPKGSSSPEWESKFIVIRRTRSDQDTIIRDARSGTVQQLWLSDLNSNGRSEIFFYEYPKGGTVKGAAAALYAYETQGRDPAQKITANLATDQAHYLGRDSFFVSQGFLIRRYSLSTQPAAEAWQRYHLSGTHLLLDRERRSE